MNGAEERPLEAQLTTARILVAQFEEQLNEWKHMGVKRRARTVRGKELKRRLPGLREGRAKWTARAAELEARIAAQPDTGTPGT